MSHRYKAGDLLEVINVPESFRHAFITKVADGRYYLYFLSMPDTGYSYTWEELENDDVCFKITR